MAIKITSPMVGRVLIASGISASIQISFGGESRSDADRRKYYEIQYCRHLEGLGKAVVIRFVELVFSC